jgi:hypothetical protein
MSRIVHTVPRGTRVIDGIALQITELIWSDQGRSFEVYRLDTGQDLTVDGCFDQQPTNAELLDVLDESRGLWRCACGQPITATDAELIDDHLRDCVARLSEGGLVRERPGSPY